MIKYKLIKSYQRRRLIVGAIATVSYVFINDARAVDISVDDFLILSAEICARPLTAFNREMAVTILNNYLDQGQGQSILNLIRNPKSNSELSNEIRASWYSGILNTPSGSENIGYQYALIWDVNNFIHLTGTCGGQTGYWSLPPST